MCEQNPTTTVSLCKRINHFFNIVFNACLCGIYVMQCEERLLRYLWWITLWLCLVLIFLFLCIFSQERKKKEGNDISVLGKFGLKNQP